MYIQVTITKLYIILHRLYVTNLATALLLMLLLMLSMVKEMVQFGLIICSAQVKRETLVPVLILAWGHWLITVVTILKMLV